MIQELDDRLWEWADWHRRGLAGGGGSGGVTLLGRMISEGWAALIRGTGGRPVPKMPADIYRTDKAVRLLVDHDQRLIKIHYFQPGDPIELKARMTRQSVRAYYVRLDDVHLRLRVVLRGLEGA